MRLIRSHKDAVIAGVCSGIARYLDVKLFIVRLIWVFLLLLFGIGIFLYLSFWLILPTDKEVDPSKGDEPDPRVHGRDDEERRMVRIWGLVLTILGMLFLGQRLLGDSQLIDVISIIFMVVGAYMVIYSRRER